jgi:hypothetical protein
MICSVLSWTGTSSAAIYADSQDLFSHGKTQQLIIIHLLLSSLKKSSFQNQPRVLYKKKLFPDPFFTSGQARRGPSIHFSTRGLFCH